MAYLIVQIFILLVTAAVGGGVLTRWWLRRNAEDVTEEIHRLRMERGSSTGLSRADLEPLLEGVRGASSAHVDLSEVMAALNEVSARLSALEAAKTSPAPTPPVAPPNRARPSGDQLAARQREEGVNLLSEAAFGERDDLKQIRGVGPKLEALLNDIGVYYFWQIADWSQTDIEKVDAQLEAFKGRISRDGWVQQAQAFEARESAASVRAS